MSQVPVTEDGTTRFGTWILPGPSPETVLVITPTDSQLYISAGNGKYVSPSFPDTSGTFIPDLTPDDTPLPDPVTPGSGVVPVDDYPYKNGPTSGYESWGFAYRQCTSFACWRVRNRTRHKTFTNVYLNPPGNWGNAIHWDNAARSVGIPVDSTPTVGSIAVRNSGDYGHVAYVNKVYSATTYEIEEYNHYNNGVGRLYAHRLVTPTSNYNDLFDSFIHFEV